MINVTKTFFPPLEEYSQQLERIWKNKWLTNRGELILELEDKLKSYLDVSNILIMNNGTIPIQIALKLIGNGGEIITTPFSYVATTSSILWENCTPIFVDIDPLHLTIDENKIENIRTVYKEIAGELNLVAPPPKTKNSIFNIKKPNYKNKTNKIRYVNNNNKSIRNNKNKNKIIKGY